MKEYHNANLEQAAKLSEEATKEFETGTKARGKSDDYVRVTVLLATELLLVAISQRFKSHKVRVGLAVLAMLLLCIPVYRIITLPRL
jgi:hypothetical protein